jgi:uncharacterized protein
MPWSSDCSPNGLSSSERDLSVVSEEPDAAEIVRQRLQADLRSAMKGRLALEVAVLRTLIAAIDNAGAVALPPQQAPNQSEVERRRLGLGDVEAILFREYETRRTAAIELVRLGLAVESERARLEMAVVSRYLSSPAQ